MGGGELNKNKLLFTLQRERKKEKEMCNMLCVTGVHLRLVWSGVFFLFFLVLQLNVRHLSVCCSCY